MKKIVYILGLAALVAACQETKVELEEPTLDAFTLKAVIQQDELDTKTVFTPNVSTKTYKVEWEDKDELAVFAQDGSYSTPTKFTKSTEGNTFSCDNFSTNSYLHIIYPYDAALAFGSDWTYTTSSIAVGCATNDTQKQTGIGTDGEPQSHIEAPLVGWMNSSDGSVTMKHVTTLLDIQVVNGLGESVTVRKVEVTTSEEHPLVGAFQAAPYYSYYTGDGSGPVLKAVDNGTSVTATLDVTSGIITTGATGHFYLITAPFTIAGNSTISVKVTTDKGEYTKSAGNTLSHSFEAGKVNHIRVDALPTTEQLKKVEISSASAVSSLANATAEATGHEAKYMYDGSTDTYYQSPATSNGYTGRQELLPINLYFKLTTPTHIDYVKLDATASGISGYGLPGVCNIYYTESETVDASSQWFKISPEEGSGFVNAKYNNSDKLYNGEWNFNESIGPHQFSLSIGNDVVPTGIRFEFCNGGHNYIAVGEMEFYTYSTTTDTTTTGE